MLLFIIGLLSGVISGMGVGGGTVLIPALIIFMHVDQHIAQSVNLTVFLPTAIIAIIVHAKNKNIRYKLALYLILAGVAGALFGSQLAVALSSSVLKKLFGAFLALMGIYEFFRKDKNNQQR